MDPVESITTTSSSNLRDVVSVEDPWIILNQCQRQNLKNCGMRNLENKSMSSYTKRIEQAFPEMAKILKDCESEHFAVQHFTVTEEDVQLMKLRDMIHGRREYDGFRAGVYVKLIKKGDLFNDPMISDTFMEKETQFDFVEAAYGDVLIAGLGIGMVVLAVQEMPIVSSVTVVEKEREVLDLVAPQLHLRDKTVIVPEDIFEYAKHSFLPKWDTIYFDIWDNICGDNWEDMKKLQRMFRSKLREGGWMSCWRKEDCGYAAKH